MLCYEETFTQENLTAKSLAFESWSALPLPQLGRHFTPGECSQEHRASPSECGQPRVWGSLSPPSPKQRMEALPQGTAVQEHCLLFELHSPSPQLICRAQRPQWESPSQDHQRLPSTEHTPKTVAQEILPRGILYEKGALKLYPKELAL